MRALTEQESNIVSLFLESALWGICLVTFVFALRALLSDHPGPFKASRQLRRPIFIVCLLLPVLTTMDVLMNLIRAVWLVGPHPPAFTALGSSYELTKFVVVDGSTLLGDWILLYRCWIVYGRSWRAILIPGVIWIGTVGLTIVNLYMMTTAGIGEKSLVDPSLLRPIVTSFWATSIAMNIISTGMIVWRIRSIDREVDENMANTWISNKTVSTRRSRLRNLIRVIIESGAIYTATAIVTCATYVSGSSGVFVTSGMEVPIVTIAFNLIIIRVHGNRSSGETRNLPTHQSIPLHFAPRSQISQLDTLDAVASRTVEFEGSQGEAEAKAFDKS